MELLFRATNSSGNNIAFALLNIYFQKTTLSVCDILNLIMGDNPDDLPYRAEYAKSGRAKCKACKADIPKGDLRLAAMVQSPFFDGKQAHWFHSNCFFMRNRPTAVGEIAHFDSLR